MYLSNSASVALAMAPTAMSASSCTVLFFAPKTCRKACIIWSACGLTCAPSLHVITCRQPQSSPCSSLCASRSSAVSSCIAKVASSLCRMTGSSCSTLPAVSSAELVSTVFSASYADVRRLPSAASGRSVQASSARARSTNGPLRSLVALSRVASHCSARLCSARHTLLATRGWSLSPRKSAPSTSGGSPGCGVRSMRPHISGAMKVMCSSQMRAIVHAAVSRTCTFASFSSPIITGIACATSGCSSEGAGPSRMEPKARVAASRRCQSAEPMCAPMKVITGCTTRSCETRATRARQVAAAMARFQLSSASSSCLHSASSSSGTRAGTAPRA
mmetsp:Transcript_16447/g.40745  ORF Transcript_16447/g.40745 Transcript_16447/m.40745 type:complete len:332 (-) Transcript_16447:1034-2029(-)